MTRIAFISIDLFNFVLGMPTKNRTVRQVVGIESFEKPDRFAIL